MEKEEINKMSLSSIFFGILGLIVCVCLVVYAVRGVIKKNRLQKEGKCVVMTVQENIRGSGGSYVT